MSPTCFLGSQLKSKSTNAVNTIAVTADLPGVEREDYGTAVGSLTPRKHSDSTLVDEPARLTNSQKTFENEISLNSLPLSSNCSLPSSTNPLSPSSVSSIETQVPSSSHLDAFHESLENQGNNFYSISSPEQLRQLLDFFYCSPGALIPSDASFPYLHGMNHVRQKVYFHEKFDAASDLHLLNYSPDEIRELFPHDLSVDIPDFPYTLMTVNSLGSEKPRLINSVKLDDLLTYRSNTRTSNEYNLSNLVKFGEVHKMEEDPDDLQELVNRNFASQTRYMAPVSHFVIYNNTMDYRFNLKVAGVIDSLRLEQQNIYLVDFLPDQWHKCSPYLENEVESSFNKKPSVIDNGSYLRKLHMMEQHLMWQFNGLKEVFPRLFTGNVFNFRQMVSCKDEHQDFKLHIHCHEKAKLPTLEALRKIYDSLKTGKAHETYFIEFPDSIAKHTTELTANEVLSYLNVLKIIHVVVVKRKEKAFVYSFDGFTCPSLLLLSISLLWTSESVEDAALKIFRKPAFKLYIYRDDFAFLKQFEQFIFWLRESIHSQSYQLLLRLPMKEITSMLRQYLGPYDWFEEGRDMNFPAYIYNSLFLGSASHSSSTTVLATLGINRLISIDRLPTWFDLLDCTFDHEAGPYEESNILKPIFLFNDGQAKVYEISVPQAVRDKLKFEVEYIVYIYNVRDDGKDSMLPLFLECPAYVQDKLMVDPEDTRFRTLLHCRVGVSRSATLAIASIMKHFKLDVLESYLYVRVRRFNVVIQPNLRLFYELFLFDEMLQRQRNPHFRRKHCWWVVCDQIARLNQSYIR